MMDFPFNLYAAGALSAFLTTLVALPVWRWWSLRTGLVDDPGHRKIHTQPVPLAGGLAVLTGMMLPLLAGLAALQFGFVPFESGDRLRATVRELLNYGFSHRGGQLAVLLAGASGMVFLGWWDDKHELRPAAKFAGQCLIALAVALAGVRITLFVPSLLFSIAVTMLWILAITNAVNFLDNMNGLCGGLGVIGAWTCGWSAAVHGQYLVALLAFLACGSLLGFLPYNFPKATAFLGDAGSHLVGFLLAVLAVLPNFYVETQATRWAVASPLFILAIPLFDLASVLFIRWRLGQPFYVGDTNHISHRLVRRGLSKTHAVLAIWLAAALLSAAAVLVFLR